MNHFKNYFPGIQNLTYLNTPASGALPQKVIDWRIKQETFLMTHPDDFRSNSFGVLDAAREKIARFLNTDTDNIALIPNFSFGFNVLLEGIPADSKILLLEGDYPSITWPVENRGFAVKYVTVDATVEKNILDYIENFNPDVLVLSLVQWASGIKIDSDFLKTLKLSNPDLLIIADGTQYLGTDFYDFESSGVDVMISSAYKWLIAGFGNGFVAIKKSIRNRFNLKTVGLNSADSLTSPLSETRFMKHFEPGHLNATNFGSITEAISFTEELGLQKIYNHLADLTRKVKQELTNLGVLSADAVQRANHSTIFSLKIPEKTHERLISDGVSCSPRGGGTRVGFHFYNDENDLQKLIDILKKAI